ncbi:hypothetical protein Lnau_0593 [Legionella nautarum]|uniref:Uncharacterized protein n=1 Tax=Legionella nautarum TaxID=45070 RepID=A0A0W0X1B4_9GAMM|nr:hypothetical protein [Legionella nautarum]KTD38338.1 hypothetical protein Lnau_0593 [Legionella nautarum]
MKKFIFKSVEPSEPRKKTKARKHPSLRQSLIERFPNEEERKQYTTGEKGGREAAKLGSKKSANFVKQPLAYQMGYDEKFAEVQAELSPEDIAANRAKAKRQHPQCYKNKQRGKRRKKEASTIVEFPMESNPESTHSPSEIAASQRSPLAEHDGDNLQELNNGYIEQSPAILFDNRDGFFNLVVNDETTSVVNNPEEKDDLLELLEDFKRPQNSFVTELNGDKNGVETDSRDNLVKLLYLPKDFRRTEPSLGADVPNLTPFATTESSANSQRNSLTQGLDKPAHLFFSSISQDSTEDEKQNTDRLEFTKGR